MTTENRTAWRLFLAVAAAGIVALQAWAIHAQSFTNDEPYHLLAGHQALRYGTNSLNLEHPPLVKLVAALPLSLGQQAMPPPVTLENAPPAAAALFAVPGFSGAGRLAVKTLTAAVFGGLLLWGCWLLGREAGGRAAGRALTLLAGLSFALFPHFGIVQTDVAATAGYALTLAAALAYVRRPSPTGALAAGCALGFAVACKFSGLLLVPAVLAALALAARHRRPRGRRIGEVAILAAAAVAVPMLAYSAANLRYDRERGEATLRTYCEGRSNMPVGDRLRSWEEPLLALEARTPGAAQWLTGLLAIRAQNALASQSFVSFGETRSRGRWWYYPVLFLIKTPLAILGALAGATLWRLRARRARREGAGPATGPSPGAGWVIAVAAGVYLAVALSSNYNIGSRHLMPIVPLLYLPAALWLAASRRRTLVVSALLLGEALAMGPFWLQATNTWWLGRWNPTRFASITGDYEWKQNFIALADDAKRRHLRQLHVVLNGTDSREVASYLPGADVRTPGEPVAPGWYAVSIAVEQSLAAFRRASPGALNDYAAMAAAAGSWRAFVDEVERGEDHGIVGGTFRLVLVVERAPRAPAGAAPRRFVMIRQSS